MLQLFQHYFGITDKSRKNRFFHRFSDFDRELCNDSDDMVIPGKFYRKKQYEYVKF